MSTYLILVRGINVGGRNKVSMTALKRCLEELGFSNVLTYINSGNVILQSDRSARDVRFLIEGTLPKAFKLDSETIKALVLSLPQLQAVITSKPTGFGDQPDKYRNDAIFLIGIDAVTAMSVFNPNDGIDKVWQGNGVIYFQRLDALRTKSHLGAIVGTSTYKCMTIRTWGTTTKLLELMKKVANEEG